MKMRPRILFVAWYPYTVSWVSRDLDILKEYCTVEVVQCVRLVDVLKILSKIPRTNISYVWFAGKAAAATVFFSKLFGKKSIVVAAGADVARVPEIGYGTSNPVERFFVQFSLRYADIVLAVSESTKRETLAYYNIDPTKVRLVYHGFDPDQFKSEGEKEELTLTVGNVSWGTLPKKGLETFVRSAKYLREFKFALVGAHQDSSISYLKSIADANVRFTGFVPFQELLGFMQRAKVYVQVSVHESFACSLAEAMLCECVPVVTRRAALPEVVGDTGYYVPVNNPKQTALKIREALHSDKGKLARSRILKMFPLAKRKREILKIIEELYHGQ